MTEMTTNIGMATKTPTQQVASVMTNKIVKGTAKILHLLEMLKYTDTKILNYFQYRAI